MPTRRDARQAAGWAAALLLAGLAVSALAVRATKAAVDATVRREFSFVCNEIQLRIHDRFNAHETILRSGAAFFAGRDGIASREEWRRFAEQQKAGQHLPGIQGLGFALLIPRPQLARHIREVRAEGFPAYQVHPEGDRERYSSIVYIEPFTNRNLRAFGYDMLCEPVRRAALERACDQNDAALSGKVRLVQETDRDVQAGTLMYMPVYRFGEPCETVAQRRAALLGWVYSPYRMTDLMQGILGGWGQASNRRVRLEVFDGELAQPAELLYDSQPAESPRDEAAARLLLESRVEPAGRPWTLRFTRGGYSACAADYVKVWLVLLSGVSVSLLLSGLLFTLLNTRRAWHEAKELAEQFKQSEEKHRRLIENSPDILYTLSMEGVFTYASPSWTVLLGHPVAQVLGRPFQAFVHPDDHVAYAGLLRHVAERGRRGEWIEYRVQHSDGRWCWHTSSVVPLTDGAGAGMGFEGTARDITARLQAEAALRESEARLRQAEKMESIGQLAGGIAHDFNNVLCGIIGYTEMSFALAEEASVLRDNLGRVLKASDRAKQMVNRILTFSRGGTTAKTVTALRPVIDEVLGLLRASVPSSVIMEADLHDGTRPVLANPTELHEVLLNLATNAVQAMAGKGRLTFRLYAESLGCPEYGRNGESAPGAYTVIEVADTGCGMDAPTLAKAFEPFFTTKAVGEGTGMGLSVVLGVVQAHGGNITVASEVGAGTTFRIRLPAIAEAGPEAAEGGGAPDRRGKERILFVDDEPALVVMAQALLGGLGYTVTALGDSLKALEVIRSRGAEIDLLITDQTMPGMTGIELAKEALRIQSGLAVILCTGYSSEVNPRRAAAIGISHCLLKPFKTREISAVIRKVLDAKKKEVQHGTDTGH